MQSGRGPWAAVLPPGPRVAAGDLLGMNGSVGSAGGQRAAQSAWSAVSGGRTRSRRRWHPASRWCATRRTATADRRSPRARWWRRGRCQVGRGRVPRCRRPGRSAGAARAAQRTPCGGWLALCGSAAAFRPEAWQGRRRRHADGSGARAIERDVVPVGGTLQGIEGRVWRRVVAGWQRWAGWQSWAGCPLNRS
jgi:hypothetical protein